MSRNPDDFLAKFQAPAAAGQTVEFNANKVIESLDAVRLALPLVPVAPFPDNLFDLDKWSKGLHAATNKYLNCYPDRSWMTKAEFYTKSANLLLEENDLGYGFKVDQIADLPQLFGFLREFNKEKQNAALVGLEEILGELFNEHAAKTVEEKEALLRSTLARLGYPNAVVQLKPTFDTAQKLDLPTHAPERWTDRTTGRAESPIDFIKRVYAPWLGHGLTRPHIRELDRPLYQALATWLRRHPEPDGFELPTLSETITTKLDSADLLTLDEARRLYEATRKRKSRAARP